MSHNAITYTGKVINNALNFYKREDFLKHVRNLEGREFELTLDRKKQRRSLDMNAYYWSHVVRIIAKEMGEQDEEKVHEIFKFKHLRKRKVINGKWVTIPGSTTQLTTEQMSEYILKCKFTAKEIFPEIIFREPEEMQIEN